MKHLKQFKIFESKQSDEEIHALCRKYNISNYTINLDKAIDVDGDVNLYNKGLTELPLKFRNVSGYFNCPYNNLTTLEGAPKTVGFYFNCYYNNLTTLEGSPETVGGDFRCSDNLNLMSLEGISATIRINLNCSNTPIEYFWENFLNKDKNLLFSFVEDWDVIREDLVVIELLEAYMEENNIKTEIDIEHIKSLGYRIE